ncbi:MAG: flagellar hook-length control protein FliK [Treponema sp.]|nr:flagellar hook-length control protein FliK [Treponema sp.]
MIPISPHTETAHVDYAPQIDFSKMPGEEASEDSALEETRNSGEQFAEILAGLLLKTGTVEPENAAAGEETGFDVPLAEGFEAFTGALVDDAGYPVHSLTKGRHEAGMEAGLDGPGTDVKGEKEPGGLDFSPEEQNILFAMERLFNHSAETVDPDEEAYLSGEIHDAASAGPVEGDPADFFMNHSETVNTAVDLAEAAEVVDETAALLARTETGPENPQALRKKTAGQFRETPPGVDAPGQGKTVHGEKLAALERDALKKAGGKEGKTRLEENREKRRGVTFEVKNLQTENGQTESARKTGDGQLKPGPGQLQDSGAAREITLELHLPNQGQSASAAETGWEVKSGQAFEDILARELHQNFNSDIVRHASMVLRDGSEGTIRLALKPETLGNVKIRLEMAENKITGHIVVESEEALRAFEREIHSLEQAFRDSGFEAASLEMSFAGDSGGAYQNWREAEASQFLPGQIASRYDDAIERVEMPAAVDIYQRGLTAVNVLA